MNIQASGFRWHGLPDKRRPGAGAHRPLSLPPEGPPLAFETPKRP